MSRRRNASIVFILVTLLLDTLGIGVILPVLPGLISSFFGDNPTAASPYYGAFISLYAAMQFLFAPIIGGLSDRYGRRSVILISLLGAVLNYVLLSVAPSLWLLFVGRVIAGITGANFAAAGAYIADVSPPEKRAQSFGLMGAAFGLGFILGPAIGGVLGGVHVRLPFMIAAVLNLVNFLYGLLVLPESLLPENRRAFSLRRANPLAVLDGLRRNPLVLGLAVTVFLVNMAQNILQAVWALYTKQLFGWRFFDVGLSLTAVGFSAALVQGGLIRAMMPRLGERRVGLLGLLMCMVGYVSFGLARNGFWMCAGILPFALGGLAMPAAQAMISREVGPTEQGELQGALTSLSSLSAVTGPLLGTSLFHRFSPANSGLHLPGAPFFAAACLIAGGALAALFVFAARPDSRAASTTGR